MRRVVTAELLDVDAGAPREIEGSIADLRTINRYFGGVRTMTGLVLEVARQKQIKSVSFLDVGGGNGDLAALTSESLRQHGIELKPVLLDRMPTHMTTPPNAKAAMNGRFPAVGGDALALPFRNDSFDVVSSCLFLHHVEPQEVVRFVNEALRVARHAVLINDLIRHRLHVALAYAGYAFYRSRITRHDAVASVRRAYTVSEIENMLRQTQAAGIEVRRFFPFRMGVIAWKKLNTT